MDQSAREEPAKLEDQLRNMIQSNLTSPTTGQFNQQVPSAFQQQHAPATGTTGGAGPNRRGWYQHPEYPLPQQRNQNPRHNPRPRSDQFPQHSVPGQQGPRAIQQPQAAPGLPHQPHQPHQPNLPQGHRYPPRNFGNRGGFPQAPQQPPRQQGYQTLYQPHTPSPMNPAQAQYLETLVGIEIPRVQITPVELAEKESFRRELEGVFQDAISTHYPGAIANISLAGFGSVASGFAHAGSDMDLAVVLTWLDDSISHEEELETLIPRLLEKAVLDCNMGGRLLTRTRVPILKVCQKPTEVLYRALCNERKKWEMNNEEYDVTKAVQLDGNEEGETPVQQTTDAVAVSKVSKNHFEEPKKSKPSNATPSDTPEPESRPLSQGSATNTVTNGTTTQPRKAWTREKVLGPLDFPKTGVGIQCDINFHNPLGIENTQLLRCYSLCDPRVQPMVLFVKSWAKKRKINSSYSGTLSSYGWVLMVLHYLVNVANPPVCPNLQLRQNSPAVAPVSPVLHLQDLEKIYKPPVVSGYPVHFWRNEQEIIQAAQAGQLTKNTQPLGALLRDFFHYYAALSQYNNHGKHWPAFHWVNEVLSLRTPGGIRTKQSKGWTGATLTVQTAGVEVRNRYLFAIEDPFETEHNVARTVTRHGVNAIRDEFRRAWRILTLVGRGALPDGHILDEVVESPQPPPVVTSAAANLLGENDNETEKSAAVEENVAGQGPAAVEGNVEAAVNVNGKPDLAAIIAEELAKLKVAKNGVRR